MVEKKFYKKQFVRRCCFSTAFILFISLSGSVGVVCASDADEVKALEYKTIDLLSNIDAFATNDERLKLDAAKAHYNMGNIYFKKGEYELAAREYYQAIILMPNDPDSHFNLAFVSGEHLRDHKTALKHYRLYLYLSPRAKDRHFVKEKIMISQLSLRSKIDSPIDTFD